MSNRNKTNRTLAFDEILKRIAENELEVVHCNGNSAAWKIFNKIRYVKEKTKYVDYVQCKTCKVLRTYSPENGTSTLKKHKCKNGGDVEVVYKSLLPEEATEIRKTLSNKSLELCATDVIPVDTICGVGFYNFSQSLITLGERFGNINLDGLLPKNKFLTRRIRSLRDDEQHKLEQDVADAIVKKRCSLSMACSTKVDGINQLIASCIYFDNDLTKLTKKIIFTLPVDESCSEEKVIYDIQNKCEAYGCNQQTLRDMSVVTPPKSFFVEKFSSICSRVDCVAFIINSILKPFAENNEISEIFLSCKAIVSYLIESGKDTKLKFKVVEAGDNWEKKISMLQKLNLNYNEVMNLMSAQNQEDFKFDQNLAEELVKVLELFIDALDDLQSTNYPTSNKVLLWWSMIKDFLNSNAKYPKPIKRAMLETKRLFQKNFVPTVDQKMSCFLDPRYRFLKMLSSDDRVEVIRKVREILDNMPFVQSSVAPTRDSAPPPKKSKFSHLEANDEDLEEKDEVNVYIHSTQLSSFNLAEAEMNIVSEFWKKNEEKLPKLSRLAISKLHTPACCCDRENPINLHHALDSDMMDDLLFMRDKI